MSRDDSMVLVRAKQLKAALNGARGVLGAWVGLSDPTAVEVMARESYDFLLLDGEHSAIGPDDLPTLLPALERHSAAAIFRPPSHTSAALKTALDAGVCGLLVPMVETPEQARTIVSTCRYRPLGQRGVGPWRASGFYDAMDSYMAEANEAITLMLQLESQIGLDNLDAILSVKGFDVLYVGPADLANALGVPFGQLDDGFLETLANIARRTIAAGKCPAIDAPSLDIIPRLAELGYRVFTSGSDIGFLQSGSRELIRDFSALKI